MQVKRYEVTSMSEAMKKIKNDLGPDAIVISTKKIRNRPQELFEVIAARDENTSIVEKDTLESEKRAMNYESNYIDVFSSFSSLSNEIKDIRGTLENFQKEQSLRLELTEIKETLNAFFDIIGVRKGTLPYDMNRKTYLHLLDNGFSKAGACRIVEAMKQSVVQDEQLNETQMMLLAKNQIVNSLPVVKQTGQEKRIKIFIGPTGVGKTTTLAKLAARYSIVKKKKVGLITTDNFRIAAAEQLETYAKIMGLRMERASTHESFEKALKNFEDKDVILVDTPGRAHPDDEYMSKLGCEVSNQRFETNLLINATSSENHLGDVISGYSRFRIDHLIVTKVDETRKFGMLYDVISKTNKPVTYLTCGQNVPQDIEEVTPGRMANLMLRCTSN